MTDLTRFCKRAADPVPPAPPPAADVHASLVAHNQAQAYSQAKSDWLKTLLVAGGAGAGLRGLYGLWNAATRPPADEPEAAGVTLPYPVVPSQSPGRVPAPGRRKAADGPPVAPAPSDTSSSISPLGPGETRQGVFGYHLNHLLLGLGGGLAGWKGTDWLVNKARQKERESELEDSRQQFQQALLAQYDRPFKAAGEETVPEAAARAIDAVCDGFCKLAAGGLWDQLVEGVQDPETYRKATNLYLPYAALAALTSGTMVYNKTRAGSEGEVLQKAVEKRKRQQFEMHPPELYAAALPVSSTPKPPFRREMLQLGGSAQ